MPYYPASIPRCQHIKVNGTQCGSPALHRRRFCFFHNRWREQHAARSASALPAPQTIDLPLLEDANSIQVALMQVMRLILRGQIEPKTAGLLLYALQTASLNLRNTNFEPRSKTKVVIDPRDVPSVPLDEDQWNPDDFEDEEEEDHEDSDDEDDHDDQGDDEESEGAESEGAGLQEAESEDSESEDSQNNGRSSAPLANRTTGANNRQPAASIEAQGRARTSSPIATPAPRVPTYRWVPPPGSPPLSDRQKAELRMLTEFVDIIAPLPAGEKE